MLGAGCRSQRFGLRHDLALGQASNMSAAMLGKVIALIDVKDGIAAQEGDGRLLVLRFASVGGDSPALLALWNEAIGVADGDAVLALAHCPAKAGGLPESEPALRGIAAFKKPPPQDEDIDPGI